MFSGKHKKESGNPVNISIASVWEVTMALQWGKREGFLYILSIQCLERKMKKRSLIHYASINRNYLFSPFSLSIDFLV